MSPQDYCISFEVAQAPAEVYSAIVHTKAWWGEGITGEPHVLGSEWTYRHKNLHCSRHKTVELTPGKKVLWHVVDAELTFTGDQREWVGTSNLFEISSQGSKTRLTFTHIGLRPVLQCFRDCSAGWNWYVGESLKQLIETGKGSPDPASYAA